MRGLREYLVLNTRKIGKFFKVNIILDTVLQIGTFIYQKDITYKINGAAYYRKILDMQLGADKDQIAFDLSRDLQYIAIEGEVAINRSLDNGVSHYQQIFFYDLPFGYIICPHIYLSKDRGDHNDQKQDH